MIVEFLFNYYVDVDLCLIKGKSSLYFVCENGKLSIVYLLFKKGVNIRLCDNDGCDVLIFVC